MVLCGSTYAIIGAGFCGLGVAAALQRQKIPFRIFEASEDVGGNWLHGVYDSVHIISSKKTTAYSDFPMPSDWNQFPNAHQMLTYLRAYAEKHELRKHIEFSTRVEQLVPLDDGSWKVVLSTGETRVYQGVMVCNGHHWSKRMPEYPGTFSGSLIHSKDYKNSSILQNKKVLVLGGGNSACDIAIESSYTAESTVLSVRRGYWFIPKSILGIPTIELLQPWIPIKVQKQIIKYATRLMFGSYHKYGLAHPDHDLFEKHPVLTSELLPRIRQKKIIPMPDVAKLEGSIVEFTNGTRMPFDIIIAATGFNIEFPFLPKDIVDWKENVPQLILGMLPIKHKNLYLFGLGQPRYGAGPLISASAELLCTLIEAQECIQSPLGAQLYKHGFRPPKTMLFDAFQAFQRMEQAKQRVKNIVALSAIKENTYEARSIL